MEYKCLVAILCLCAASAVLAEGLEASPKAEFAEAIKEARLSNVAGYVYCVKSPKYTDYYWFNVTATGIAGVVVNVNGVQRGTVAGTVANVIGDFPFTLIASGFSNYPSYVNVWEFSITSAVTFPALHYGIDSSSGAYWQPLEKVTMYSCE